MRRRKNDVPEYLHFKPRNLGYSTFKGKKKYFPGPYQSTESISAYHTWLKEVFLSVVADSAERKISTIGDLALMYLKWAKGFYPAESSNTFMQIKDAVVPFSLAYIDDDAESFDALMLEAYRDKLAATPKKNHPDETLARTTVNAYIRRIKRMFRWGAKHRHISRESLTLIQEASPIPPGRQGVRETQGRSAISYDELTPVVDAAAPMIADMLMFLWHTCCRPSAMFRATPRQFYRDQDGTVIWKPRHKLMWKEKKLFVPLGPKAEAILLKYIDRPQDSRLFQPLELSTSRSTATRFSLQFFDLQIKKAQKSANAEKSKNLNRSLEEHEKFSWTMYQIRHGRVTMEVSLESLTSAKAVAGHASIKTTQVYSHADMDIAKRIAKDRG